MRHTKVLFAALIFLLSARRVLAQGGVFSNSNQDYYTIKDCFKASKFDSIINNKVLPATRILKGTRVWRVIDLKNPVNREALNTSKDCEDLGLLEIIKFGLLELGLKAFANPAFGEEGLVTLENQIVKRFLSAVDSAEVPVFDSEGNLIRSASGGRRALSANDVQAYLLKEDWVMNSYNGRAEKHLIAFAPLVADAKTGKTAPLFWLYFNEWRSLLAQFDTTSPFAFGAISYLEIFENHYFVSRISKESNVFDRSIKSYRHGADSDLESELIKEKLHAAEQDLFEH